jgi:hypothetical protein
VTYGVILYLWVATAAAPYVSYKQWQPAGEYVSLRALRRSHQDAWR